MTIEITPPEQKTSRSQKELARVRVAEGIRNLITSDAGNAPASFLALAQVAPLSSRNGWITRQVCGRFAATAESCFGRHAAILGLVETSLRQIIFACLSEILRNPDAFSSEDRAHFAADALTLPAKTLLGSVYRKQPPPGLVKVISALGEAPRAAEVYPSLWTILDRQPQLARPLAHSAHLLADEQVHILSELPPHEEAITIATKFSSRYDYTSFCQLYQAIRKRPPGRAELDLIARGASPSVMLRKAYQLLPFPEPPCLPGLEDMLEFLPNGRALTEAAIHFENCARNLIGEALSGQILFYTVKGDVSVMLSIERDPFGLRLKEMKSRGNGPVDFAFAQALETELSRCGVRIGLSVQDHLSILELDDNQPEDEVPEMPWPP